MDGSLCSKTCLKQGEGDHTAFLRGLPYLSRFWVAFDTKKRVLQHAQTAYACKHECSSNERFKLSVACKTPAGSLWQPKTVVLSKVFSEGFLIPVITLGTTRSRLASLLLALCRFKQSLCGLQKHTPTRDFRPRFLSVQNHGYAHAGRQTVLRLSGRCRQAQDSDVQLDQALRRKERNR